MGHSLIITVAGRRSITRLGDVAFHIAPVGRSVPVHRLTLRTALARARLGFTRNLAEAVGAAVHRLGVQ